MHDALAGDAHRPVLAHRLDDQGEGEIAGLVGAPHHARCRGRDARRLEPLLHAILAKGQAQDLGRRAREGDTQQLEDERHRALEARVARERLAEVERAVDLELKQAGAQAGQIAVDGHEVRLVADLDERAGNARGDHRDLGARSPRRIELRRHVLVVVVVEDRDAFVCSRAPGWRPLRSRLRRCRLRRCFDRHGPRTSFASARATKVNTRLPLSANLPSSRSGSR